MNNETGEHVEWGDYWARHLRRRAEEAGAEVYITDMRVRAAVPQIPVRRGVAQDKRSLTRFPLVSTS